MGRTFYSDYVKHMIRFYSRSMDLKVFKSSVDRDNWNACHTTLILKYNKHKDLLLDVYSGYDTLDEEVSKASIKYSIDKKNIWDLMKRFEKDLAIQRGLYYELK